MLGSPLVSLALCALLMHQLVVLLVVLAFRRYHFANHPREVPSSPRVL
jgi:hypothetical protein